MAQTHLGPSGLAATRRLALLGLSLALVSACGTEPVDGPVSPNPSSSLMRTSQLVGQSAEFSADVTINISDGVNRAGFREDARKRVQSFHLDSHLRPDGHWNQTLVFSELKRSFDPGFANQNKTDPRRFGIARVETSDAPNDYRVYNRLGELIPRTTSLLNQPKSITFGGSLNQPAGRSAAAGQRRNWLAGILLFDSDRQELQRRLKAEFEPPTRDNAGMQHSQKVRGDTTLEIVVDPTLGLLNEAKEFISGREVSHVEMEFARAGDKYVMTHLYARQARKEGDRPSSVEVTISNARLTGESK